MKGFWFSLDNGKSAKGNLTPKIGKISRVSGEIIPCKRGLHFSPTPWAALNYANGSLLWHVESIGLTIPHGDPVDKFVCRKRKYLKCLDLTRFNYAFAAKQALKVLPKNSPEIVMTYINETANGIDKSDIRSAARAAARDAAWDAALAAAWSAAWDAAWSAARAAAWDAAWDAAMAVARNADRAAARAAAWDASIKEYNNGVYNLFGLEVLE